MANLFFIHTPFQLMVAQMIIDSEHLKDNIMIYGYVEGCDVEYKKIYDLIVLDDIWSKKIEIGDIGAWYGFSSKNMFRHFLDSFRKFNTIKGILETNEVTDIYFGDINNLTNKFEACVFSNLGYRIHFFEEGTSHYCFYEFSARRRNILFKFVSKIYDLIYCYPIFKIKFGHWLFVESMPFNLLPITTRFSILPFYKDEYDKLLIISPRLSDKLNKEIKEVQNNITISSEKKAVLFLDSVFYADDISFGIYIELIKEVLACEYNAGNEIYIKFHPRTTIKHQELLKKSLSSDNIEFNILSPNFSIPLEYLIGTLNINKIIDLFTSTIMYSSRLFDGIETQHIYKEFYERWLEASPKFTEYITQRIAHIESIRKKLSEF